MPSQLLPLPLNQVPCIGSYLTLWPASKEDISLALQKNRWVLGRLHITQVCTARIDGTRLEPGLRANLLPSQADVLFIW